MEETLEGQGQDIEESPIEELELYLIELPAPPTQPCNNLVPTTPPLMHAVHSVQHALHQAVQVNVVQHPPQPRRFVSARKTLCFDRD